MSKTRSELREKVMIILYQIEIMQSNKLDYNVEDIIKENLEIDNEFVRDLVYGTLTYETDLDKLANTYLDNWKINRIEKTGACILRMALYELKYMDTPHIVVINEAVELAKKYGDESLKNIVNAVLDKVVKEM